MPREGLLCFWVHVRRERRAGDDCGCVRLGARGAKGGTAWVRLCRLHWHLLLNLL